MGTNLKTCWQSSGSSRADIHIGMAQVADQRLHKAVTKAGTAVLPQISCCLSVVLERIVTSQPQHDNYVVILGTCTCEEPEKD